MNSRLDPADDQRRPGAYVLGLAVIVALAVGVTFALRLGPRITPLIEVLH